jgi:ankyrin repeat protein
VLAPVQPIDLFELVKTGVSHEIQVAINRGADVNARDEYGRTPLMFAAEENDNLAVVNALLKAGADVNAKDIPATTASYTMTALMYAAKSNANPAIISALCTGGADVNAESFGMTPLMWAAYLNGNPDVTMALLKAGANAKAKDNDGRTAFDYAQANEKLKGTDAYSALEEASQ